MLYSATLCDATSTLRCMIIQVMLCCAVLLAPTPLFMLPTVDQAVDLLACLVCCVVCMRQQSSATGSDLLQDQLLQLQWLVAKPATLGSHVAELTVNIKQPTVQQPTVALFLHLLQQPNVMSLVALTSSTLLTTNTACPILHNNSE